MQKSKSNISFGPTTEYTEFSCEARSQRRSSLDTFLIPGRIRLPSSKTSKSSHSSQNATDTQIAQTLFDHSVMLRPKPARAKQIPHNSDCCERASLLQRSPTPRSGSGRHTIATRTTPRPIRRYGNMQPVPRPHGQDALIIRPHRAIELEALQTTPDLAVTDTATDPFRDQTDGPNDPAGLRQISRMASMSWSTISHRILSNSSSSSRASRASEFKLDYNILAEEHGLPLLVGESSGTLLTRTRIVHANLAMCSEEGSNSSQTKVTRKSHHGWLARKIFRRSSSTYTLKAKTSYKPLKRKKSLASLHLLSESGPSNILLGRTLEGLCRLGGLGIVVLPSEFAIDKLILPTCLSATATYILQHGKSSYSSFAFSIC